MKLDSTQSVFKEYFEQSEASEIICRNMENLTKESIEVEYLKLLEQYNKLLKSAVKIARIGDRAQKNLIRYKELVDKIKE